MTYEIVKQVLEEQTNLDKAFIEQLAYEVQQRVDCEEYEGDLISGLEQVEVEEAYPEGGYNDFLSHYIS